MLEIIIGIILLLMVPLGFAFIGAPTEDEKRQDARLSEMRVNLHDESYWRYEDRGY